VRHDVDDVCAALLPRAGPAFNRLLPFGPSRLVRGSRPVVGLSLKLTCSFAVVVLLASAAAGADDEGPEAHAVEAPTPRVDDGAAPPIAAPAAPLEKPRPARTVRIAVYKIDVIDVPQKWGDVVMTSVTAELRKLSRVSVIGADEIRSMLDLEADKQRTGCSDDSCLPEIADALGVDVIVTGSLARVGNEHVFALRRLDQREARVTGAVNRHFTIGNGEEFLAAIGPAVGELFSDHGLKPGAALGVSKEMAKRLNPPPLPVWPFATAAVTTGVSALAAGALWGFSYKLMLDHAEYKATANPFDNERAEELANLTDTVGISAQVLAGVAGAAALATAGLAVFTDFEGETADARAR
jgi:hypothetical protein